MKSPFAPGFDAGSRFGSLLLADYIAAYWKRRGFRVKVQRYQLWAGGPWGVRSDLVAGLPRR